MRAVVAVIALVTCIHAGLWGILRDQRPAPDFSGLLQSVSYNPFPPAAHYDIDYATAPQKIRADLREIAKYAKAIRLYSSTDGNELVPAIAKEFDLKVTLGAWLDKDNEKNRERNEREIAAAIDLAHHNSNVIGIVVGNETIYRGQLTVDELTAYIRRVKGAVEVPVTTGDIWSAWDRESRTGIVRRFHRRALSALLGVPDRRQGRRSRAEFLRCAAQQVPWQAHRDRRVRLAQRRLQSS